MLQPPQIFDAELGHYSKKNPRGCIHYLHTPNLDHENCLDAFLTPERSAQP